ncbi:hypothetical protein D1872_335120 [compost metagenome]
MNRTVLLHLAIDFGGMVGFVEHRQIHTALGTKHLGIAALQQCRFLYRYTLKHLMPHLRLGTNHDQYQRYHNI